MTEYTITMIRSPGVSDEERRKRVHQAFALVFSWANSEVAASDDPDRESTLTATGTPASSPGQDARGV